MLCFPMLISPLPGANPPLHEHKIEVFVLFWPSEPLFSGFSSTKSRFLCAFEVRNPRFQAFRAQNRGFCALIIMKWQSGRGKRPRDCGWVVVSSSDDSKFGFGKGVSGSGSSKIDIGMRAAGSWQLAVGTGPW